MRRLITIFLGIAILAWLLVLTHFVLQPRITPVTQPLNLVAFYWQKPLGAKLCKQQPQYPWCHHLDALHSDFALKALRAWQQPQTTTFSNVIHISRHHIARQDALNLWVIAFVEQNLSDQYLALTSLQPQGEITLEAIQAEQDRLQTMIRLETDIVEQTLLPPLSEGAP